MMGKVFGSFQDLIVFARQRGFDLDKFYTKKDKDMAKLARLNLPQYATFSCSYRDFKQDNPELAEFLEKHETFFIRARPTRPDLDKGYTFGLKNFKEMREFIDSVVGKNKEQYADQNYGYQNSRFCP